jgi:type IX secretion system PorP/SprF family membrane protein
MRLFCLILFVLFCITSPAQELAVYNEYHLNKSLINPAIIGSEECTWVKATDRHQWVGIEDAPQIQTLSVEACISNKKALRDIDKRSHGVGIYLYRDKNGAYQNLGGQLSYAYHFFLSKKRGIKLGMGLAFRLFQASLSESGYIGDYDPAITGGTTSVIKPDVAAGLFLYNQKFFAGLSAARLLNQSSGISNSATGSNRNYFLMVGYLTGSERDNFRLLPSIVIKTTETLQKQIDLNAKLLMGPTWWLALSYRHQLDNIPGAPVAIIPMVGLNKGNLSFAYALDLTPGAIQKFNYGTHEFMISWHICRDGYRCPVYR